MRHARLLGPSGGRPGLAAALAACTKDGGPGRRH